ncbi:DUF5011 domain-containing protein [Tenacibaculum sp. AHE15PA]|uniref:immunoglobulin-like domain-containing protein n=1 Tax=Tenacibaculum sp. AHE15PA TaxID=2745566 RepID=UPI001C4F9FF1|nr:immunoglobulin-like domain-containing protein [Tenacibaculum sp. AHE15PA]QXP75429.1 DUF5011 domain-containing protein [Tenacibaculum sp. AHE15PA]
MEVIQNLDATVTDCETGLTATIDASGVDMSTPGNYTVTYNVTDTAGNAATQVTRTVTVQDTTAPVITLVGANPQVLEACGSYTELDATVTDCETGLTATIDASGVDMSTPGNYTVTYNVTDTAGNAATQVTRTVTVQDTTAPVITLVGANPQVLEACGSYTELDATVTDCETGLTATIDASGVDMSTPGNYTVTYNVTDTAGNAATQVTRTVTVQDTTAPVITLVGANPQVLEACGSYTELDATVTDCETGLTATIDASGVDMSTPGNYTVTYNVTDTAGNAATQVTRTVTVQDTTAPVITLVGANPQVLEACGSYTELDATVTDCETGLTATIDASGVDMSTPGNYTVTYNVTDTAGNAATQVTRTVTVQDTTAPVITLVGANPQVLEACGSYTELDATVTDCETGLTATIDASGVDMSTPGNYTVTYNVTDTAGNAATQVTRTVTVQDTTAPVITLVGANPQVLEACGSYTELDATVTDCETGLTATIDASGVDMSTPGNYTVTYNVTDTAGNAATQVTRTVTVQDTTAPVITLVGANPQVLEACGSYTELDATVTDCETGLTATIDASGVDMSTPGNYTVTYNVTDTAGNAATQVTRTVTVQDTTAPVITLVGANPQVLEACGSYTELDATVTDCETGLTATIDASGVDMSTPGNYTVTYNVTDTAGNAATQVTRTVTVQDTTAPVITLVGANPQVLEACGSYTELDATVTDCETGLTATIDASGVDMSTPGNYTVTYNVTDTAGNAATQVTRTVTVQDTTAPVITLVGANPQVLEACGSYTELDATVTDCETGLTATIDASGVDMSTPGNYTVTYNVTDTAGNAATQVTRTVTVQDTTAPVITLVGANPQVLEACGSYTELDATVTDCETGLTATIDASGVDMSTPGNYTVTYNVTDTAGNAATQVTRTVTVQDTTAPVITLVGANPQVLEACGSYTELDATVTDCETGLTATIDASGVDMSTPGNYTVTYNVTDTAGNAATQVTRTVTVQDTTAPVITLVGANPQVLEACGSYTELDATVTDCETGLTATIDASGVDMSTPGNYTVTYNVTDTAGNAATQVTRTVTVQDTTAPVITLVGANPQVLEACGSYTELDATVTDCETGLTATIDASGVDMSTPGNYTVTYNVTDTAGNAATQVTRTVTVQDTTAPVITLVGANPQVLEACGSYIELDATVTDCETGLTATIDASGVDMSTPGNYTVTYNVTDTAGNAATQVTRTVTVQDTTAPVITLVGANPQVLEACGSYTELDATVTDCETGLTATIDASGVDMSTPGNYTVTYNVTDTAGNAATQVTRTVTVQDTTAPVITLVGANPQVLEACGSYTELDATVTDCETGLTATIDASGVDMSTPGNYTVTYNVTDTAGNAATQVTRTVTVQDTTAPVITLVGANPQVLEACGSYTELDATVTDCETGLTATIDASGVDMSTPGNYTVTYNVTDTAGNAATQVTRTVTVQDTTAPVITLVGANPQVLEACGSYTELDATVTDCETGLTATIDASGVDMSTPGNYTVTYNVTDTAGNAATQVTRTVTVQDTTAPVITLVGANPQVLEACGSYTELDATVTDCETGLTATIDASGVDMSTPGNYTVTYNVTDTAGNAATQVTRTVTVQDTTAPVITLVGANPQVLEACGSYTELDATVTDCETGLTATIDASGVDMSTPGNYTVTYNVTDTAGNAATQVTRTVTVQDTTAPVITLVGANPQVLEACGSYTELDATVTDCETGLTATIDASGVDMSTPGNYTVTYNVTDTAGNAATQVTRTVTVQDTTAPVITLVGANPQVLEACGSYTELDATVTDCETGLTATIDASGVDMSTPGNYTVTYNVTDTAGNAATQVTRTVTVQDTTAPVITLVGANPQVLEACGSYTELDATVTDCETGLTATIDASGVDMSTPGNYTVTYNVTDTAGNAATQVTRTVTVQDTTAPVITLVGANPQVLEACGSYTELDATVTDCETGLTATIDASGVDMSTPGNYTVTYNVTDTAGNAATQVTRTVTVQDTTAPVITLVGANPQVLEACGSYTELDATVTDCETGLTATIDASGVDMSTPGNYTVTYNVTDTAGNAATQVTRTVTVQDTTAPVITLVGANPQVLEACGSYTELDATVTDCETGLTATIDASGVDMSTPGNYTVTYNVTDTAGNAATQVTRTVTVQDTTAPVITLVGANPQVLEACGSYTELDATVTDCETGLTATIDASGVDMSTPGNYTVTYNVTDTAGNAATQVTRTVTVQDTTAPVITLVGANPQVLEACGSYTELDATVTDCETGLTATIDASGVDMSTPGNYTVTYNVTDTAGNAATQVTRTVTVQDTTAPVITLVGANPQVLEACGSYIELDATVTDCETGLTATIDASGVDMSTPGNYTVTYNVTDTAGNAATQVTRTVTVQDTTAPVITLVGANPQVLEACGSYTELDATVTDCETGLTATIDASGVDMSTPGNYTVTYNVTDTAGNAATQVTRTVTVQDTTAPVITLVGANPQVLEACGSYTELDATVTDCETGLTATIDASGVDMSTPGNYTVTYNVTDTAGNAATQVTRTVTVQDTTAPVITLVGANPQVLEACGSYTELDATVTDCETGLTATIDASGVDMSTPGNYTVTYNVTDTAGNAATQVTRTVTVQDTTAPVITLVGANPQVLEACGSYTELDATVTDCETGLTATIDASGVDMSTPGNYTVTYNVTDTAGNAATQVTRTVTVQDTTAPVITLVGANPQVLEACGSYTELDATVTDCETGLTATIDASGVDMSTPGNYTVTYNVTDTAGNAATQVTRTVTVQDTTAPVITLVGANPQVLEACGSYTELDATVTDCETGLTATIDASGVDMSTPGNYTVTYNVTDTAGNAATQVTRTVTVQDTTAPVITLVGANPQVLEACGSYTELDATVTDCETGLTATIDASGVDMSTPGNYTVTYNVTDTAGNAATQVTRTVTVQDTTAPVITLVGANPQVLEACGSYTELDATVTDCETGLTATIDASGVDMSTPGNYTVTYNVTDTAGNAATQVTRTVTVQDTTAPVITLVGANPQVLEACGSYTELDATVTDCETGLAVTIGGDTVDTTTAGTYTVTYNVTDIAGNIATEVTRVVTVQDTTVPVITLTGAAAITLESCATYTEAGATVTDCETELAVTIGGDTVDTTTAGTYTVTYNVTDTAGNIATEVTRVVTVQDTTVPVITLTGAAAITLESCATYTEAGATVTDCETGLAVTIGGDTVDTTTAGTYTVTYNVTDTAGNIATEVTRVVTVEDTTVPVITLTGAAAITLESCATYTEAGAAVTDCETGLAVTIGGDTVDTTTAGTYTVTYNVTDTAGNAATQVTRTVTVQDCKDTDGDGIADAIDLDDDNDGIPDSAEGNGDTDGDGIPDSLDLDSDNDGILDVDEGGNGDLDTNNDGVIDPNDGASGADTNGDGQADASVDAGNEEPDTDGDGVPDYQDLDSDNDGITDVIENGNGGLDTNNDGVIDANDAGGSDVDGDGISDSLDGDTSGFGVGAGNASDVVDSDGDGVSDYQDLDSDDDGINDVVEGGNEDTDGNGQVDGPDTDGDGILDVADQDDANFGDTGNDDVNDSDPTDPNSGGDGAATDSGTDTDGDGIPNSEDGLDGFGDDDEGIVLGVDDTCIVLYNEFTPNGDGVNDYLVIDCIENFPNNSLEIFNRWGNKVYKVKGYNNTDKVFRGVSNGRANFAVKEKLPVGTYFYILDLGSGFKIKKGWIYINK